jgi:Rrf2 family nitric oxide-sensitive transcriptional repressor
VRLTRYTDYSLRVLTYLAVRPDGFGTVQSIAEAYGISRNHLMKVVQELSRRGYIDTVRGKGGGMRLRLPPDRINIGRVVRDMESDLPLVECFGPDNRCVITPECVLKNVLADAMNAFMAVLGRYTLADLVSDPAPLRRLLDVRMVEESDP